MANFATDADLLVYEPTVFVDVPVVGQQKLKIIDGELTGNVLTSVTGGFTGLAVQDVVVIRDDSGNVGSYAVASVTDDNTVALAVEPVELAAATGLTVIARTFEPQIGEVHDQLMRAIGIDPEDSSDDLDESAVLSEGLMKRLEVLGALVHVYAGAMPVTDANPALVEKAEAYRRRFGEAVGSARVLIDTDGDGLADVWRAPAAGRMVRV